LLESDINSTAVGWAHCHKLALGYCAVIGLPQIRFDQTHPSQLPLVLVASAGLWEKVGSVGQHCHSLQKNFYKARVLGKYREKLKKIGTANKNGDFERISKMHRR